MHLLESQMSMMVELSQGRSILEVKSFVEDRFEKQLLKQMFSCSTLTYGLRTAALKLYHNLYINIGSLVPNGNRPELVHIWGGGKGTHDFGSHDFVKMTILADSFHGWLVEKHFEENFTRDLRGFMTEMKHIVENELPWNGMNSSKRLPFHQQQGEFVLAVLQTIHFLVSVRYYNQSDQGNEHKGAEVTDLLVTNVLVRHVMRFLETRGRCSLRSPTNRRESQGTCLRLSN